MEMAVYQHRFGVAALVVECPFAPGWDAFGFYFAIGGSLHLAEVRIRPALAEDRQDSITALHGNRAKWDWVYDSDALSDTPPPHEVYRNLLRRVPLAAMLKEARNEWPKFKHFGETAGIDSLTALPDLLSPAEVRYLEAADMYAAEANRVGQGNPRATVGRILGIKDSQVRDRLRLAREKGYLTKPGPGRTGGELTELGRRLAEVHLTRSANRSRENDR